MTAKYEAAANAEENERKALMEKLRRDKAEVVALMQKDKNEKLEEMLVAKEMQLQEALTKKTKETESLLQAKEEEMRAKYNEKVQVIWYSRKFLTTTRLSLGRMPFRDT